MHNNLTRIQNVFGFFTSVAFAVAAAIAVSVVLSAQSPSASLELRNIQVVTGRPHYYSSKREEYAHVKFDLDAERRWSSRAAAGRVPDEQLLPTKRRQDMYESEVAMPANDAVPPQVTDGMCKPSITNPTGAGAASIRDPVKRAAPASWHY
ncbi:hypothetical protein B0A55_03563 [Friedmanniomyces simplex]|uniref:Transmembrane protein n=1 Tax=Friedmanniomyces simplex TaxID=329884 RepID=A0A4U0Y219_9PEZI|nr:hypothetical protein B0A55_03563 [Friedmanniomyces simplex]